MEIIRAGFDDTELFSEERLRHGACCFFTEDRARTFFFEIRGREAVLYADDPQYADPAIEEFLFYSKFICCVESPEGRVIWRRDDVGTRRVMISSIQPSQFYVNARKLACCKTWMKNEEDVLIPTAEIGGKTVSLDGHTRMRAALDLGFEYVNTYLDDCGEYIAHFVREAEGRGVFAVADMEILSDEEYKIKWHRYCDDFFGRK